MVLLFKLANDQMQNLLKPLSFLILLGCFAGCAVTQSQSVAIDPVAENMLLYQLENGGWPQDHGDAIDYQKQLSAAEKAALTAARDKQRATIDDQATTGEINYLLKAYDKTKQQAYLAAAERGIRLLLDAQNEAGGWPQEYPNPTGYHAHITYNDNAMIDVMWVMRRTAEGTGAFAAVSKELREAAATALDRGIDCILKTQYTTQDGQLTAWGAQYDQHTLQPASARKFEPVSISGKESVGIIRFLLDIERPSEAIKKSVRAAVAWLQEVRIDGVRIQTITDPSQPSGKDRILVKDAGYTSWARFYELDTFRPVFAGRDGIVRYDLKEIDNGRRVGYGFYGKWAKDLLNKEYPRWEARLAD